MKNRIFAATLALAVLLTSSGCQVKHVQDVTVPDETLVPEKTISTLRVRYCDETYTKYLEYCKENYEKEHDNVEVILELADSESYINNINDDSQDTNRVPDVYITDNSNLGTLYLAGLAAKNKSDKFVTDNYCDTALNACSYNGSLIAYPLGYETCFMVYNADYLKEDDVKNFASLEAYADEADFTSESDASIETIFRGDLNEMFMNYGYIGNGIDVGGIYGEDTTKLSINNDTTVKCAREYVALIDYFSLSTDYSYYSIVKKFCSGNILSAIVRTSSIPSIAKSNINYKFAKFPDYSDDIKTTPLSITSAIVVNPYSVSSDAQNFAEYASYGNADELYNYTGIPSAMKNASYDNEKISDVYDSYTKSMPKNKAQYGEQVYPLLEIAMHNIAAGEDSSSELQSVEDYMKKQF